VSIKEKARALAEAKLQKKLEEEEEARRQALFERMWEEVKQLVPKDGVDGKKGLDGSTGAAGPKGERGEQGIQGEPGITTNDVDAETVREIAKEVARGGKVLSAKIIYKELDGFHRPDTIMFTYEKAK